MAKRKYTFKQEKTQVEFSLTPDLPPEKRSAKGTKGSKYAEVLDALRSLKHGSVFISEAQVKGFAKSPYFVGTYLVQRMNKEVKKKDKFYFRVVPKKGIYISSHNIREATIRLQDKQVRQAVQRLPLSETVEDITVRRSQPGVAYPQDTYIQFPNPTLTEGTQQVNGGFAGNEGQDTIETDRLGPNYGT